MVYKLETKTNINTKKKNFKMMCTNDLVKQYKPLLNKICYQYYSNLNSNNNITWDDIMSMAYEGFVLATKKYDSKRSQMSFTQYAAFAIKHNILTRLNEELRTVRVSCYNFQKNQKNNIPSGISVPLDNINTGNSSKNSDYLKKCPLCLMTDMSDVHISQRIEPIIKYINKNFTPRQVDFFMKYFGLDSDSDTKVKDIAQQWHVTPGYVSQQVKLMINNIKNNKNILNEILN